MLSNGRLASEGPWIAAGGVDELVTLRLLASDFLVFDESDPDRPVTRTRRSATSCGATPM